MRSWIWGGCLTALTSSGVYLVFAGATGVSHCGPCVACSASTATTSDCSTGACPTDGVTEVIDIPAELARPRVPAAPFISFDEPPLASPPRGGTSPVMVRPDPNGIVTVGYIEPAAEGVEVAPRPRKAAPPGEIPLASPTDPY